MKVARLLSRALVGLAGLALAIQLVPYGREHSNPPITAEPAWDSPATRALARRACFDCHSNETRWGWTSHVAPASWLVQRDVDLGRGELNFSEWQRSQEAAGEAAESVREGEMPPLPYLLLHPSARLSPPERAQLIEGLSATLRSPVGREEDHEEEAVEQEDERQAELGAPARLSRGRCGGSSEDPPPTMRSATGTSDSRSVPN
jgi:mono/diheme cytochrome c family protein